MQDSVPRWTRLKPINVPQAEEQFINCQWKEKLNPGHSLSLDETQKDLAVGAVEWKTKMCIKILTVLPIFLLSFP